MALILLNRLPIPNLKHYCFVSLILLIIVILYAQKVLYNITNDIYVIEQFNSTYIQANGYVYTIVKAISNEPWCIWVITNTCYCALLMFAKIVQGIIFGSLRVVEYQHIKDQFWNFIFLKFIFVFGVLNLENGNEVCMWCTWFSILGFLAIHSQICKDRFEYLSFSSTTPLWSHIKVIALLNCIICVCMLFISISIFTGFQAGFSIGLFMLTESLILTIRTAYVLAKYAIHLWDLNVSSQWDNKATVSYYVDFTFEMTVVLLEFLNYIHMLLYGNFFLSMASIVICMELRRLFFDIKKRIKRHSNYLLVIEKMERRFPWATKLDINDIDKCAVCWEKLDKARKLPCGHFFHHNCLRSWLEQDTSCPTCRLSLQDEKEIQTRQQQQHNAQHAPQPLPNPNQPQDQEQPLQVAQQPPQQGGLLGFRRMQTNLFHFDGSRYVSWLPSFSVEVTHNLGNNLPGFLRHNIDENRLNAMAQQVSTVFPHLQLSTIIDDLRQTNSAEITIENILQERVAANPATFDTDSDDSTSDDTAEESDSPNIHVLTESSNLSAENEENDQSMTSLLARRKRELMEASRRRYLTRSDDDKVETNSSTSESNTQNMADNSVSNIRFRNVNNQTSNDN